MEKYLFSPFEFKVKKGLDQELKNAQTQTQSSEEQALPWPSLARRHHKDDSHARDALWCYRAGRVQIVVAHKQLAHLRVVCKLWLRISNSLTPFFINRMNAMQIALTKQAAMRKPRKIDVFVEDEEDEEMAECEHIVAMRLMARASKEMMAPMLATFGVPLMLHDTELMATALAEQLCNETDDEEY